MFKQARVRRIIASIALLAAFAMLPVLAALAQGELQLGNQTYSRASAPALRMPVTRSARFFRGVGGVAFSAVAQGQRGQIVTALRYDPAAADGQRLVISVREKDGSTQTARGHIYDWQLVPTAEYALDENGSAVTLFGSLENKTLENVTLATGGRVINYHPRLQDTLLGLRLFQADILIIQPNAADLFKENGRIIVGIGEGKHNLVENQARFRQISEWQDAQATLGNKYQSYVVGDLDQRVTFAAASGAITFTGTPSWNAWRRKYRSSTDLAKVEMLEKQYDSRVTSYNTLVGSFNAGTTRSQQTAAKLAALKTEIEALEKQLEDLNAIEEMPEYSRSLSQRIKELDGINPVVYQSVKTVMYYRALFKHYQGQNLQGYAAFVKSLNGVPVRPSVTTPTIQRRPAPQNP
jgi:hypothetical protein